uniref:Uncharacterized protein n=1 Tax=Anguilla anguilla TaxID=7936 RepID=A0A0E9UYE6_ANGAN
MHMCGGLINRKRQSTWCIVLCTDSKRNVNTNMYFFPS